MIERSYTAGLPFLLGIHDGVDFGTHIPTEFGQGVGNGVVILRCQLVFVER